ncbi:PPOX class F420-dependent oxidoreductase [Acidiferrimicrobium sp. IK]|uniref:PPOX class F420-dependent oxidoreductase n=1 Tax=Acidiferrimicrobium sp. IK TaxID=2871700 RepID=UPI0021CB65D6|nr:PPOX class F420-dependent oxidoreductase [Acidiferrimicrobium sp. IK]MCU4186567.1 PPOX class F420-dependent oxidoreductase [Acidiferrimicrobium sp. IK]
MTSIPESHQDLLQSMVATLATVGTDGRPQLSAVWFLAEGDTIRISLNEDRQKTKNLHANPAMTVFILDLANPFRYLEVRGDARIEADTDYAFASKVGEKYSADVRAYDRPGTSRVVVTLDPVRVNAVDMSAG